MYNQSIAAQKYRQVGLSKNSLIIFGRIVLFKLVLGAQIKKMHLPLFVTKAQAITTSSARAVSTTVLNLNWGSFLSKNVSLYALGGLQRKSPLVTLLSPLAVRPCDRRAANSASSVIGCYKKLREVGQSIVKKTRPKPSRQNCTLEGPYITYILSIFLLFTGGSRSWRGFISLFCFIGCISKSSERCASFI